MSSKPCRCPTRKEGAQRKVSTKVKPDVATEDAAANSQKLHCRGATVAAEH